jgi:membrane fusion protein (multidrug efflux system)
MAAVSGIDVSSEVAGQVSRILFESGQSVQKGEMLLQLDDDIDQAQLQGLIAERKLAQLKFKRVSKLIKDKSVSQSDYDEARATLDNSDANVAAQQALIEKKLIRAPFDGRLGIRRVDLGEYLEPGTPIVPLEQLDPIYTDFTLPERELAQIARGQRVEVKVQAYPNETFHGQVDALDPGASTTTRSFRVRAQLSNPGQKLRPGMFADVRILLPEKDPVLTIPDTAVSYNPYGDSVFMIQESDGTNRVKRRQITTGSVRNGRVAVLSGLSEGERVVSAGHNKLRNEQAVILDTKPAPADRPPTT